MEALPIAVYSIVACTALAVFAWGLAIAGLFTRDPARVARFQKWAWPPPVIIAVVGVATTIVALIVSFHGIDSVGPESRARVLAEGISATVNCGAFTVVLSITGVLPFILLVRRQRSLRRAADV